MKYATLILLLGTLATHVASEIQEGELPPLPAMAASLGSPNSQPLDWAAVRLSWRKTTQTNTPIRKMTTIASI